MGLIFSIVCIHAGAGLLKQVVTHLNWCMPTCMVSNIIGHPISFYVVPSNYLYPTAETVSVNGSSPIGNCSNVTLDIGASFRDRSRCEVPTSSVLFDGNIPTLTGLDGDMWASQLLALQLHNPNRRDILLVFRGTPNYTGVELVMFNCPEWGIALDNIELWGATSLGGTTRSPRGSFRPTITSCDSLMGVCTISSFVQSETVTILQFTPTTGSNRTYLAEVRFYGDSSPDTIITAPLPDTTTPPPSDTTTPSPPDTTTPPPPDTTAPPPPDTTAFLPPDTTIQEATQEGNNTLSASSSSSTIVIAASIGCVVLLIVCLLAAVLILWRCYYVKHHKHNTSHHPAVGEGHINTHSHPPPVTLCEETGQVYYSTLQEVAPEESSDTYSHIHHDTITGRGASKKSREGTVADGMEMGEYSMLSYRDKPQEQNVGAYSGSEVGEKQGKKRKKESKKVSADATVDQLYAQVDKKKKEGDITHPQQEDDAPVDQLYAQVDKKKKEGDITHPQQEDDAPVDQLYAQVDKKKKEGDITHPQQEDDAPVDQLYAQVDKKKKEGDITHPQPEADAPVDQLYAQVDKKKKERDTAHPHPPEADTPVDQLYAQVDKKNSRKKEACEDSPPESGAVYSVVSKPHPPQVPAKSDLLMDDLYN